MFGEALHCGLGKNIHLRYPEGQLGEFSRVQTRKMAVSTNQ